MNIRGKADATETRQDVRDMAEALSLFGSAMRHMAERRAQQMVSPSRAAAHPARSLRLVLAPALAAAAAVAVAVPAWNHFHSGVNAPAQRPAAAVQYNTEARASVNDTVLMNQIDSNVSEDVPDALEPLAQLSEHAAATKTTVSEKNDGSQK
jgi:hypothetical protein